MKKRGKRWALTWAALGITALMAAAFPQLRARIAAPGQASPPGVRDARRQLIVVWYAGQLPGAAAWLREQAAAYGRQTPGARVWLRTVTDADLAAMDDAPPDLLVFSAEAAVPPGEAISLCRSGYGLLAPDQAAATPRPGSLLGVSPIPDPAAALPPAPTDWPESFWASEGFGALALQAMQAPSGARFAPAAEVLQHFLAGEPALLSVAQARSAAAQGARYRVIRACPATDLALYGRVLSAEGPGAAFLAFLLDAPAQRALADRELIPAAGPRLYGADHPLLQALEAALDSAQQAPACLWPLQKQALVFAAEAMYRGGAER